MTATVPDRTATAQTQCAVTAATTRHTYLLPRQTSLWAADGWGRCRGSARRRGKRRARPRPLAGRRTSKCRGISARSHFALGRNVRCSDYLRYPPPPRSSGTPPRCCPPKATCNGGRDTVYAAPLRFVRRALANGRRRTRNRTVAAGRRCVVLSPPLDHTMAHSPTQLLSTDYRLLTSSFPWGTALAVPPRNAPNDSPLFACVPADRGE